ncbi:MAG TPA: roadblock/LC7 domain-containing protein [Polyangiaceae bacterium]|nr:roadblock/LC7 domain-containing protein [Polyangiaceae bacterium]
MLDLNTIAALPEVIGVALSDSSGALLETTGEIDGEACGAVHSFSVMAFTQAGEALGLGEFQRASVTGPQKACLIAVQEGAVLGIYVDPGKQFSVVEKKLQNILQK